MTEVYALDAGQPLSDERAGASHDPYTSAEPDIPMLVWKHGDGRSQGAWTRAERLNGRYDYMRGFSSTIVGERGMIEVLGEGGGGLVWNSEPQHLLLHREGKETVAFRFDEGPDDVWESEICYYSQGPHQPDPRLRGQRSGGWEAELFGRRRCAGGALHVGGDRFGKRGAPH